MLPNISVSEGLWENRLSDYTAVARQRLSKPLGRLIFSAKKFKVALDSSRQARQEASVFDRQIFSIDGISNQAENTDDLFRSRRETLYAEGVARLIEQTVDGGLGDDRFLARLTNQTEE